MPLARENRWLTAIALALAIALCTLSGCESSPTVPVPPPATLSAPDIDGYVTLTGDGAPPEAYIFALNEDTKIGVIETVDLTGSFSVRLLASPGDTVSYWLRVGSEESPPQSAIVPGP